MENNLKLCLVRAAPSSIERTCCFELVTPTKYVHGRKFTSERNLSQLPKGPLLTCPSNRRYRGPHLQGWAVPCPDTGSGPRDPALHLYPPSCLTRLTYRLHLARRGQPVFRCPTTIGRAFTKLGVGFAVARVWAMSLTTSFRFRPALPHY